jgi:hypothetical protein
MRQLARVSVLVAAASAALALAGPFALLSLKDVARAASEVSVAFVVDFGRANKVEATCVKVPSADNEYQALAAFTQQDNEQAPTYNNSGLLCSIGGIPNSGCGQSDGEGFIYWSYWHGDTGTWEYSNTGASGIVHSCNARGEDCDVEGWRFEDPGSGNPNDPPPEAAADYADICAVTPPPTTTTTTALSSPTTTAGSTMPSATDPNATNGGPSSGGTTDPPVTRAMKNPTVSSPSAQPTASSTPKAPAAKVHRAVSLPNSAASTTTTSEPDVKIQALGGIPAGGHHGGSGGAGSVWIAGGILLVLVVGSLYGWRRRVRSP